VLRAWGRRVMTGQCCTGEGRSRPARRLSGAVASVLPGAVLVLLPKCPLCLAAWLTVAMGGVAVSARLAEQLRSAIAVFWAVALAVAGIQVVRRRLFRSADRATVGMAPAHVLHPGRPQHELSTPPFS
jgi:hypothetical protein